MSDSLQDHIQELFLKEPKVQFVETAKQALLALPSEKKALLLQDWLKIKETIQAYGWTWGQEGHPGIGFSLFGAIFHAKSPELSFQEFQNSFGLAKNLTNIYFSTVLYEDFFALKEDFTQKKGQTQILQDIDQTISYLRELFKET